MGTVDESMPVPKPVMTRPTIKCAFVYADVCKLAPTMTKLCANPVSKNGQMWWKVFRVLRDLPWQATSCVVDRGGHRGRN